MKKLFATIAIIASTFYLSCKQRSRSGGGSRAKSQDQSAFMDVTPKFTELLGAATMSGIEVQFDQDYLNLFTDENNSERQMLIDEIRSLAAHLKDRYRRCFTMFPTQKFRLVSMSQPPLDHYWEKASEQNFGTFKDSYIDFRGRNDRKNFVSKESFKERMLDLLGHCSIQLPDDDTVETWNRSEISSPNDVSVTLVEESTITLTKYFNELRVNDRQFDRFINYNFFRPEENLALAKKMNRKVQLVTYKLGKVGHEKLAIVRICEAAPIGEGCY
jgi:hypothetical protein